VMGLSLSTFGNLTGADPSQVFLAGAPTQLHVAASLAAACSSLLVASFVWHKYFSNLPPGPYPLPIVGNLLAVAGDNPEVSLQRLAQRFGSVMTVYLGSQRTVVLSSPEAVKEAMVTKGGLTAGRVRNASIDACTLGGKNLGFSEGVHWRRLRKTVAMEILHKTQFMRHLPKMVEEVTAAKAAILARCAGQPQLVDPFYYLRVTFANIIFRSMLSERIDFDNLSSHPDMSALNEVYLQVFAELGTGAIEDFVPLIHMLPTPHMTKLHSLSATRDKILGKMICERRQHLKENGRAAGDVMDALILRQEEIKITDQEIVLLVSDLLSAGSDTGSSSTLWLLRMLAAHPEAQDAVQQELDIVFGSEVPAGEISREKLPVLSATIMETMRIRAVAPLALPHANREPMTISGYSIPANSQILVNNSALMMDPTLWDRPEEFRPRRFLEEEAGLKLQGAESRPNVAAYKFVPFGVGPRYCPGQAMAQVELFLAAAHLLHAFRWSPPPGEEVSLETKTALTLEPKVPQELLCTPRWT